MLKQLTIQPKFSRSLWIFFAVLHVLIVFVILNLDVTWVFKFLLLFCFSLSAIYCLSFRKRKIQSAYFIDGAWQVEERNGNVVDVDLLGDTVISPFCVILNFRVQNSWRRRSLVVMKDAMNYDVFRQMRILIDQ